ncbi:MAG: hypothetical protein IJH39_07525 [Clostridia bacterium]|nr:hypothetical protein [Clostridia bacterium]
MGVVIDYEDKISYTEVYDILMFLNDEEKNKIPNKLIDFFKNNKLENYITKVNPYIPLELQKVRKETKAIIACIYRKYLADEEEKEEFKKKDLKEIKEERKHNK